MILSYRRGNLEGLLEARLRTSLTNWLSRCFGILSPCFPYLNVFLNKKAKRRMEMAEMQKNEGFLARLVKITNTFVQKPLIFAPKFANA